MIHPRNPRGLDGFTPFHLRLQEVGRSVNGPMPPVVQEWSRSFSTMPAELRVLICRPENNV